MFGSAKYGNLKAWPNTPNNNDEQSQFVFKKSKPDSFKNSSFMNKGKNETAKSKFNFKASQKSDEDSQKGIQSATKNEESQRQNDKSKLEVKSESKIEPKMEIQASENTKSNNENESKTENQKSERAKAADSNPAKAQTQEKLDASIISDQNSSKQRFQMKFNPNQQAKNYSFKRPSPSHKKTKKQNKSEINNTSELYEQVQSIVDNVFRGKDQNAKLTESLSNIIDDSIKEIAERNKRKSRESKKLSSPKNQGPDINLIYTDPSMATQDPSITMMVDPSPMMGQDPYTPFGISLMPMMPNQIPMMPNQLPMIPNQIPMMPNQPPMMPNQIPMMPNQVPMMPNQMLMMPAMAPPMKKSSDSDSESSSSYSDSSSSYSESSSSSSESDEENGKSEEEEEEEVDLSPMKVTKFEYSQEKEFDGIMNFLNRQSGGNVHDKGTVEITSNSVKPGIPPFTVFNPEISPKNLVDYDKKNYYFSLDNGDAEITFDFKDKKVKIQYYTIKSLNNPKEANLKNWVIEGSKNGRTWKLIDDRKNDKSLKEKGIVVRFKVNHKLEYYRFIRLRQTGQSWCTTDKHNKFGSEYMEFFGHLKEPLPPEE